MNQPTETIGLIAGEGSIPLYIAQSARRRGFRLASVMLKHLSEASLAGLSDTHAVMGVGKLGGIIEYLKRHGVKRAVLAGKVPKTVLYGRFLPDLRALSFLIGLKDRRDDSILNALSLEFSKDGIELMDMKVFLSDMLTPVGPLTKRKPGKDELKDIEFGFKMAKEIGRLDIGQTVVVKDKAVMAVEAAEGTDEAIRRGGKLAGSGAVVVKVSRPGQDMRFDVPASGLNTIESMASVGAKVLALEAGMSFIVDKDSVISQADKHGIAIFGVSPKFVS